MSTDARTRIVPDTLRSSTDSRDDTGDRLSPGTSVGRYVILERVGSGGMGVVYSAYDPKLDRKVAVKLLHAGRESGGAGSERLLREAQAMARLSHPNVIAVFDVGTLGDDVFLAMEYVQGQTLRRWVDAQPRSWRDVVGVFVAAARGLAAAHAAGIIHRDFKPANVLVGNDGGVRVLDFGVARPVDSAIPSEERQTNDEQRSGGPSESFTKTGVVMGTPAYMAPEQHFGHELDGRADQFSYCVALFEALHGKRPFKAPHADELVKAIVDGRIERTPENRTPGWLDRAVARGLSADPVDRWLTMDALIDELSRDRMRKWRWTGALGATAIVAIASGFGYGSFLENRSSACGGAGDKLAPVWSDERKTELARSFVATGLAYAESSWERTEAIVDAYAVGWAADHRDACEATHVRHEQSEKLLDVRMACLGRRLQDLEGLTRVFSDADAEVVKRAIEAARGLPDVGQCADPNMLARTADEPSDDQTRATVAGLRTRLAFSRALSASGRYEQAHEMASRVVVEADALGYAPLRVRARHVLGIQQAHVGDPKLGVETLAEAAFQAEAHDLDESFANIAGSLSHFLGYRMARHDEGKLWAQYGLAKVERLGDPSGMRAHLIASLGSIATNRGDLDEALAYQLEALSLYRELEAVDPLDLAAAHNALGSVLLIRGEVEQATPHFDRALEIREAEYGPNHPMTADTYSATATVLMQAGQLDEAKQRFEHAIGVLEAALGPTHHELDVPLQNLAGTLHMLQRHAEAAHFYRRALAIHARSLGTEHPVYAGILSNLGAAVAELGDHEEAIAAYEEALEIYARIDVPNQSNRVHPSMGIGYSRLALEQPELAIRAFERAVRVADEAKAPPGMAGAARFGLARALWASDRGRALVFAHRARDDFSAAEGDYSGELGELDEWLAEHRVR